jgi:hypothetical protein
VTEQNGSPPRGYLLFLWSPTGYTVSECEGEPPQVGDELEDGLVVTKVGASPFPVDARDCVYSMGRG